MTAPEIFPSQPELTDADRRKLAFGNDHVLREWLQTPRRPDDYKKAVLVELERPSARLPMIQKLLIALQRAEKNEIGRAILKHITKKNHR